MIDDARHVQKDWVENAKCVGITAGASAPEVLVAEVIAKLKEWGANTEVEYKGIEEKVVFSLPKELRKSA
jgi:4-hydroxy-3-methylbut-2-enyl diphosphate reductase